MQYTLKLFASLSDYLPSDADGHIIRIETTDTLTSHQILEKYAVPREQAHLVLINGVYVDLPGRDQIKLKDGDVVAAWPPVAGG